MIATKPSPVQPKFSFSEYDGIIIGGSLIAFSKHARMVTSSSLRQAMGSLRS